MSNLKKPKGYAAASDPQYADYLIQVAQLLL